MQLSAAKPYGANLVTATTARCPDTLKRELQRVDDVVSVRSLGRWSSRFSVSGFPAVVSRCAKPYVKERVALLRNFFLLQVGASDSHVQLCAKIHHGCTEDTEKIPFRNGFHFFGPSRSQ